MLLFNTTWIQLSTVVWPTSTYLFLKTCRWPALETNYHEFIIFKLCNAILLEYKLLYFFFIFSIFWCSNKTIPMPITA